jgi:AraC family transcriptional regulator
LGQTPSAELLETARREFDHDRAAAKTSLSEASLLLRLEIERSSKSRGVGLRGGLAAWQILRVRHFIDRNLHRTVHIGELCKVAQRSPAHFARSFKQALGHSPHAYIVKMRLQRACHLMATAPASLSEIALTVGFCDQAHLCKLFRRTFGQSPSVWRRKCQSQEKLDSAIAELLAERQSGNIPNLAPADRRHLKNIIKKTGMQTIARFGQPDPGERSLAAASVAGAGRFVPRPAG